MSRALLGDRDKLVYGWEHHHVDPFDLANLDENVARMVINYVWADLGLLNPPRLKIDPKMGRMEGYGNRMSLILGPVTSHVALLHELAHSMDVSLEVSAGEYGMRPKSEVSGGSFHDDNWLGLYVMLLDKHLGGRHFNYFWLMKSLLDSGLTMSLDPKPRCI